MFRPFNFAPCEIGAEFDAVRHRVRAFVAERQAGWSGWQKGHSWTGFDRALTRDIAREGWIGMTWPERYGGRDSSMLERYVVLEELLSAGAPVGAHWIGDRQTGPLILRVGTEEQKLRYLPPIARGEIAFCIGMSEPDSGSDLASIRTKAIKVDGGWRVEGRKIWTTHAHLSDFMLALVRTSGIPADRHGGLSQVIIDLGAPGVEISRIADLTGESHFAEVVLDGAYVPDDCLVGGLGRGWEQVMAELAFERSGPERFLSAFPLLPLTVDRVRAGGDADVVAKRGIGEAVGELVVLRQMSVSVAGMLAAGDSPEQEAAVVKELGVALEQRLPDLVRAVVGRRPDVDPADELESMLGYLIQIAPSFSLRGGTREIIRSLMARGLGLR